jgi:hypothetical protein
LWKYSETSKAVSLLDRKEWKKVASEVWKQARNSPCIPVHQMPASVKEKDFSRLLSEFLMAGESDILSSDYTIAGNDREYKRSKEYECAGTPG